MDIKSMLRFIKSNQNGSKASKSLINANQWKKNNPRRHL